nr:hypothetical protein [Tanacetum cinerariifolium]
MDSLSPQVVSATKLPILNPNEFDLWKTRIEQYFLMTDYSLWEVILNGDSPVPTRIVEGVVQPVAPTTAEQKLARKNELKACGLKPNVLFLPRGRLGKMVWTYLTLSGLGRKEFGYGDGILVSRDPNVSEDLESFDSGNRVIFFIFLAFLSLNFLLENFYCHAGQVHEFVINLIHVLFELSGEDGVGVDECGVVTVVAGDLPERRRKGRGGRWGLGFAN